MAIPGWSVTADCKNYSVCCKIETELSVYFLIQVYFRAFARFYEKPSKFFKNDDGNANIPEFCYDIGLETVSKKLAPRLNRKFDSKFIRRLRLQIINKLYVLFIEFIDSTLKPPQRQKFPEKH